MSDSNGNVIFVRRGAQSAKTLQPVIDEVLRELHDPNSETSKRASTAGFKSTELADIDVKVREPKQGIEPVSTIVVTIAVGLASHAASKFWDDVIWPRLRDRFGVGGAGKSDSNK
jgi:hypothetical protein